MAKSTAVSVIMTTVSAIGEIGPISRDINGDTPDGGIRGPFQIEAVKSESASTYPVLYAHDAPRERCMEFEADSEGFIRKGRTR